MERIEMKLARMDKTEQAMPPKTEQVVPPKTEQVVPKWSNWTFD